MNDTIISSLTSSFCVQPDNRYVFIWRESGTRNNPAFEEGSVIFGGGGQMVWAGISIDGCTNPHIIPNEDMTGLRYMDEILKRIVVSYAAAIEYDYLLMEYNCKPHRVHMADDFLFEERIIRME